MQKTNAEERSAWLKSVDSIAEGPSLMQARLRSQAAGDARDDGSGLRVTNELINYTRAPILCAEDRHGQSKVA